MPYIKNARGARIRYAPTKIASKLSEIYFYVYSKGAIKYRSIIMDLTDKIHKRLESDYGSGDDVEWKLEDIRNVMEKELRKNADDIVVNAFILLNPPIIKKTSENEDDIFNSKSIFNKFEIDPVWSFVKEYTPKKTEIETKENLNNFGTEIKKGKSKPIQKDKTKKKITFQKRRSEWLKWWKSLSASVGVPFSFSILEDIVSRDDRPYTFDSDGWWEFWEDAIFESLKQDPRIFALLRVAQQRKIRSALVGQDWLDGTGLNQKEGESNKTLYLIDHPEASDLYRLLWKENMKRLDKAGIIDSRLLKVFDLDKLAVFIDPIRDKLIDWRGYQYLRLGGCLWDIPENHYWGLTIYPGLKTTKGSKEPPQWAWMRLAMALSINEEKPWDFVMDFYNQLSKLAIIPSESMLRQAGRKNPNFLEDKATRIEDKFESIYEGIHEAAVGTKWTGTVSMDWSKIRSVGSPVRNGVRKSKGIMQFSKAINEALLAQNRETDDKPVTMYLPLWHMEVLKLIKYREEELPNLQSVIGVSDLFMRRLRNNEDWTIFDPVYFPELNGNDEEAYLKAENKVFERKKINLNCAKVVSTTKLWNRLLSSLNKGMHSIVFTDSNKICDIFPNVAPGITGLDGVGLFPLPKSTDGELKWIKWPSMVVNLIRCVDSKGMPQLDRLNETIGLALRMMDNAINLSLKDNDQVTSDFRSICLGNVGFYEVIDKITKKEPTEKRQEIIKKWMGILTEAWSIAVIIADQNLAKQRGVANAYNLYKNDFKVFDPVQNLKLLQEMREGALRVHITPNTIWERLNKQVIDKGSRFISKSCWAPFNNLAAIAGVSPGGIGSLKPVENIEDEKGKSRWVPTPILLNCCHNDTDNIKEYAKSIKKPNNYNVWHENIKSLSHPKEEAWRNLLEQASLIRPWNDQGISVTLPLKLSINRLNILLLEAWWHGLNVIRFDRPVVDTESSDEIIIDEDLT